MKPLKFKTVLLALLLFSGTFVFAQNKLTKEIKKEYQVSANSHLILQNRYGSINIKDWDKNSVSIDVVITVENPKKETAEKYLEYITIDFSEEGDIIRAVTNIDEKYGRAGTRTIVINSENKLSIDYTVNMPKNLKISVSQRYGDVFINELTGEVAVDIRYGNLTANKLTRGNVKPLANISLSYSKGTISEASWLNLDLKYAEIKIDQSQALVLVTKYSRINADKSSSVVATSKYDRYTLGNLNNLVINGAYTNINAESISNRLELESRYGGVKIDKMPAGFGKIIINSSYTNVSVGIDAAASYQLNGNASYGSIKYPSTGRISRIAGNKDTTVNGFVGTDENSSSEVIINARYGNVNLVR
jgi:hypothetical protein